MGANVRCLTTSVGWMITILHKTLSSAMVVVKVDTEEDRLEVPVESKECMDNLTKGTACLRRHRMIIIPLRQQMQERSVKIIPFLAEIVPPPEDSEVTDALDLHSHQKIHSSSRVLVRTIMEACQTCSVAPSLAILVKARDWVRTWDSKAATRTLCAATLILPRYPAAPALPSASLVDDPVPLQLHKANRDCLHRANLRVNRATADTWARCMAREAPSMVVLPGAWVAIISMVATINRQEVMEAMGRDMAQVPTATAIVEDGEVPVTGTEQSTNGLEVCMSLLISACSLLSQNRKGAGQHVQAC